MKQDLQAPPRLQPLHDAKPGLRDAIGGWLRARLGLDALDTFTWGGEPAPSQVNPAEVQAQDRSRLAAEPADAASADARTALRVTLIGAPHPTTERLFQHVCAIVDARDADGRAVEVNLATSAQAVDALPADVFVYLRSDCARGAARVAAALDTPERWGLMRAATLLTGLDDRYWNRPELRVEPALQHAPYLAERLGEVLGVELGARARERSQTLFADRMLDAQMYGDPLGYLLAVDLDGAAAASLDDAAPILAPMAATGQTLVARVLQAAAPADLMIVAADSDAARRQIAGHHDPAVHAEIRSVEDALADMDGDRRTPRTVCLVDVADEPRLLELVEKLQDGRRMLCGVERSVERLRRLCSRCVDNGVGHHLTFVFEGAEWKALPRALFEA